MFSFQAPAFSTPEMTALGVCLALSLLWAPAVLVGARMLAPTAGQRERVYLAALLIAILPTVTAPLIAAAGVSLRPVSDEAISVQNTSALAEQRSALAVQSTSPALSRTALPADVRPVTEQTDVVAAAGEPIDIAYRAAPLSDAVAPGSKQASPLAAEPIDAAASAAPRTLPSLRVTAAKAAGAIGILYIYGALLMALLWLTRGLIAAFTAMTARPLSPSLSREEASENGADEDWAVTGLQTWAERLGVTRLPVLRVTPHVSSVCLTGLPVPGLAPVILIPDALLATASREDIVLMCAHELAHCARGDRTLFSATQFIRVLFWFNPFMRALAEELELAAEEETDARVIRAGAARRDYAACFVEGLKFARDRIAARPAIALAFTPTSGNDRGGRKRRLNRILTGGESRTVSRANRAALLCAASIAGLTGLAQAALAVDPDGVAARGPIRLPMPIAGDITFGFGEQGPVLGPDRPRHEGIDIRAAEGVEIVSPRDGVVTAINRDDVPGVGYGKTVTIDHGGGLTTRYAHLSAVLVEPGTPVEAGTTIARVGSTGKSTGPHLHFEALVQGVHVDPRGLINLSALDAAKPDPATPVAAPTAIALHEDTHDADHADHADHAHNDDHKAHTDHAVDADHEADAGEDSSLEALAETAIEALVGGTLSAVSSSLALSSIALDDIALDLDRADADDHAGHDTSDRKDTKEKDSKDRHAMNKERAQLNAEERAWLKAQMGEAQASMRDELARMADEGDMSSIVRLAIENAMAGIDEAMVDLAGASDEAGRAVGRSVRKDVEKAIEEARKEVAREFRQSSAGDAEKGADIAARRAQRAERLAEMHARHAAAREEMERTLSDVRNGHRNRALHDARRSVERALAEQRREQARALRDLEEAKAALSRPDLDADRRLRSLEGLERASEALRQDQERTRAALEKALRDLNAEISESKNGSNETSATGKQ